MFIGQDEFDFVYGVNGELPIQKALRLAKSIIAHDNQSVDEVVDFIEEHTNMIQLM